MSEELITLRPFAFYVLEEELVPAINEPSIGAYNPVLQIWVYGEETGMSPIDKSCSSSTAPQVKVSGQFRTEPGGWDYVWDSDGSD